MLRSVKYMQGFTIQATDGEIGDVDGFLFDDWDWKIRYMVVDTGKWLPGRKVLVSPESFGAPLWDEKKFPVNLTVDQVRNSPDIDVEMPVTREKETELHGYFGWRPYWTEMRPAGGRTTSSRLLDFSDVKGYTIRASDGEIGGIDDLIITEDDWTVRYLVADTKKWLPGKKVLLSPEWIKSFEVADEEVVVDLDKESVRSSPEYHHDMLDREYESRLYTHYVREGYWTRKKAA